MVVCEMCEALYFGFKPPRSPEWLCQDCLDAIGFDAVLFEVW